MSNAPSLYYLTLCVLCWCCFLLQSPISFSWQKVGCLLLGQQPLPNVVANLNELTELSRLPGLNWVAQRENILNAWYSKYFSFSDWRYFWDEMAPKCQPCQFCVRNKWKLRWVLALGTHPKLWERGRNPYHRFQSAHMSHLGLNACPLPDQAHLCGEATR